MIEISHLSKTFGHFKALEDLNLSVGEGEIYGLIGPNGSGKTTTISILLDILSPDPGAIITIAGRKIPEKISEVYQLIGFMPQDLSLYLDLTVEQNLKFFAKLYRIPKSNIAGRIQKILELVDMEEFRKRIVSKCSGGMQRRCSLAVALIHEPSILILDEPTVGVDPELRIEFWDFFKQISREKEVTILITTHYLAESTNCDRIGLMNKKIVVSGTPEELMKNVKSAKNLDEMPDMEDVFIYFTHQEKKMRDNGHEN
ncbi:MAG: ABC transporter ATP-binding protein [Candidatus Lokiarchaeota archaeon]|nr:ABC transporter ATP-binding protein [Candidatus Lokiarchaeota archaeon]